MIIDDLPMPPFDTRRTGKRNEFLVRRHITLPEIAAVAIRRRRQPGWSRLKEEVRA